MFNKKDGLITETIVCLLVVLFIFLFFGSMFVKVAEKARIDNARMTLAIMCKAENMYFAEYGEYVQSIPALRKYTDLSMEDNDWVYLVDTTKKRSFVLAAIRKSGINCGKQITINHLGQLGGDIKI